MVCFLSTIALDILNHRLALRNNFLDSNAGVVISQEDKEKREKIPKRATIINSCFFALFIFSSIAASLTKFDRESKTLFTAIPNAIANALRNPILGRFAFHVNNQIMRQTVEDRRNVEIKAALQKREERRKQKEQQENEHEVANPNRGHIVTVSAIVERQTSPKISSMPSINV